METDAFDGIGQALLETLQKDAGTVWAAIPAEDKQLAKRAAGRWAELHLREAFGANPDDLEMLARQVRAQIAVLRAEVTDLLRSALLEYAQQAGMIVGKVAMAVLKGAVGAAL